MDQFPPDIVEIATRRDDPATFDGSVFPIRDNPTVVDAVNVMLLPAVNEPKYPPQISFINKRLQRRVENVVVYGVDHQYNIVDHQFKIPEEPPLRSVTLSGCGEYRMLDLHSILRRPVVSCAEYFIIKNGIANEILGYSNPRHQLVVDSRVALTNPPGRSLLCIQCTAGYTTAFVRCQIDAQGLLFPCLDASAATPLRLFFDRCEFTGPTELRVTSAEVTLTDCKWDKLLIDTVSGTTTVRVSNRAFSGTKPFLLTRDAEGEVTSAPQ